MKKTITHNCEIDSFTSILDLSAQQQELIAKAKEALKSAYSPYSGFSVGSALLLANDKIVLGSNQENIAYPSGMCAERVAIFSAGTLFPGVEIKMIAIAAKSVHGEIETPITPCGSCRQVMIEIEASQKQPITVIMAGDANNLWVSKSVENIVPFYFTSSVVGKVNP